MRLKIRLCHGPLIGVLHKISQDTTVSFSSRRVKRFGRAACGGGGRSCLSFFGDNVRHFKRSFGGNATLVNSCEV